MRPRAATVRELSKETGIDEESVLLTLWELGYEKAVRPHDLIPARLVEPLRAELGVATSRELGTPEYWADLLRLTSAELQQLLREGRPGLLTSPSPLTARDIRHLRAYAEARRIDPLTGRRPQSPTNSDDVSPSPDDSPPPPSPRFDNVGSREPTRLLSGAEVAAIHYALAKDARVSNDPIDPPGVRDEHLLESAIFRQHTAFDSIMKYPTVETAAAALLCAIVHNHPFHNGNKRTALVSMLVFLDENGLVLTCSQDDLFRFVLSVARHRMGRWQGNCVSDLETHAVAEQICKWSRRIDNEDRPLSFRKLRPILKSYGCKISIANGKAHISLRKPKSSQSRARTPWRTRKLSIVIPYRDDGREIPAPMVAQIRKDLELDGVSGVDSTSFYHKRPHRVDDFIVRYRRTLRRLAKL